MKKLFKRLKSFLLNSNALFYIFIFTLYVGIPIGSIILVLTYL